MEKHLNKLSSPLRARSLLVAVLFFGVLAPLLLFAKLAEDLWRHGGFRRDIPVLRFIHHSATPQRDNLMVFVTHLGGAWVMIPLTVVIALLLIGCKRRQGASFLLLAVGGTAMLNLAVKSLFQRARPTLWLSPAPELDYGFPSGHAMLTMALTAALIVLAWPTRWRWPAVVAGGAFVLAVGLSRLYLGVHFPSDILAGWSVTVAWVTGLFLVLHRNFASDTHRARDGQTEQFNGSKRSREAI